MAFTQKLNTFRECLEDNRSLLRDSLRGELAAELDRPHLSENHRREARELLFLCALREGNLPLAKSFSEGATPALLEIFSELQRFQKHSFRSEQLQSVVDAAKNIGFLHQSALMAILDCLTLDDQERLLETHERKMNLLVMGLPPEARSSWRKIQGHLLKNQICRLEMRIDERSLMYAGQRLDFSSKRSLFQILKVLGLSRSMTIDEAIHALWQTEMEESYFARLRTAIQRLNEILASVLPIQKAIELNSRELKLSSTLELHIHQNQ